MSERLRANVTGTRGIKSEEERREVDDVYLEGLYCSPERIAEEQAALDESA